MPIRPELRRYYNAEWRRYVRTLIAITGHRCTICGACNFRLTGMHTTHDPRDMELVAIACVGCHARYDAGHALAMRRRGQAKRVGQLWLLPELQWAPYAGWMIPRRVIAAAQGRLF
jgi:hypothetical protein